jgi:fatty-acid desaturase
MRRPCQRGRGGLRQALPADRRAGLAVAFYMITGLGVTAGFHRLLTGCRFTAAPVLRAALAIAGCWAAKVHWSAPVHLDSRQPEAVR